MRWSALIAVWLVSGRALAAPPAVRVIVTPPDNLADSPNPMPELWVRNNSKNAIEFDVFVGAPFTILEARDAKGHFQRPTAALCGNGFRSNRLGPQQSEFFPLWSRLANGPGLSGTYRVVLPYRIVRGRHRDARETTSPPFVLAYGDVPPPAPATHPGSVVLVSAERARGSRLSGPSPAALGTRLLPQAAACVAVAQKHLPWLRGRFTLVVEPYVKPSPALFVGMSLLGDRGVNACLGAIAVHDRVPAEIRLMFAVSPPTP